MIKMKAKYILWITALFLLAAGCGKEPPTPTPPSPTPTPPPTELSKQWHLVGFVHVADSTVTPPERMRCKSCFSLTLGADGTISGQGFLTMFAGSYRAHDGRITLEGIGGAADGEQPDGKQYIEALRAASRYEILSARRMRLYYNEGKDYLLFREWGETDNKIPAVLLDNKWKLSGFVRMADGVVQEVQPGNCGRCYSIQMLSNGVIAGRTSANEIHGNFEVWGDQIRIDRFFAVQPTQNEPADGKRYIATMSEVTRYEVKDGKLKFYYNNDENYLLFRVWKESKEEIIPEEPPAELLGRTWRLLGFGGPFDYAVREPEPTECRACYTLTFSKDGTMKGRTSSREISGRYKVRGGTFVMLFSANESAESSADGREYIRALDSISTYILSGDRLTFYSEDQRRHLLFCDEKVLSFDRVPPGLSGVWKLVGFVSADGTLREPDPKHCDRCYTISFLKDGRLTGRTINNEAIARYQFNGHNISISDFGMTKVGEYGDSDIYVEALRQSTRYELVSGRLRLYYNNNTDYLLFKKTQ